jgi:hypothetical protein
VSIVELTSRSQRQKSSLNFTALQGLFGAITPAEPRSCLTDVKTCHWLSNNNGHLFNSDDLNPSKLGFSAKKNFSPFRSLEIVIFSRFLILEVFTMSNNTNPTVAGGKKIVREFWKSL